MWTIAGGNVLALIIILLLPAILGAAVWLAVIALGAAIIFGVGALFINYPEHTALIVVGFVIFAGLSAVLAIYFHSRNWRLFLAELGLLLRPAFTLHAKAVKEKHREEHSAKVQAHVALRNNEIQDVGIERAKAITEKVWRRYSKYGVIVPERKGTAPQVRFSIDGTDWLFDIKVTSNFPTTTQQHYSLYYPAFTLDTQTYELSSLKGYMRKRIKDVLMEKERKLVRASVTNE